MLCGEALAWTGRLLVRKVLSYFLIARVVATEPVMGLLTRLDYAIRGSSLSTWIGSLSLALRWIPKLRVRLGVLGKYRPEDM